MAYHPANPAFFTFDIEYQRAPAQNWRVMKRLLHTTLTAFMLAIAATAAGAECYADYKAKRDNPLKLQYGVIALSDTACGSLEDAAREIAPRIAVDGWILLNVLSIFDASGLAQRQESAGQYYLRY